MSLRDHIITTYKKYGTPALTNFRLEHLAENGAYEAGVFVLADMMGSVVLVRRKPVVGQPEIETFWWLPGGAHEAGEGLGKAAVREFREETGLDVSLDRLLVALLKDERFFMFWFRGHVVTGSMSTSGDPCNTTAEVRAFAPADIPVGALWSEVDKVVLAWEGFIDYPIQDFMLKLG